MSQKVLPYLGDRRVQDIRPIHITRLLDGLFTGGRSVASLGRPRTHPAEVYELVAQRRAVGASYGAIAAELNGIYTDRPRPYTKDAVARLAARQQDRSANPVLPPRGLAITTVEGIHEMLSGAWAWLKRNGVVADNVVRLADVPVDKGHDPVPTIWMPEQYKAFFGWDVCKDHRLYPLWFYSTTSAERRSGNVGLHWDDVDLEAGTARFRWFVKVIDHRLVVEDHGKDGKGQLIYLDPRTVAVLRRERARQAGIRLSREDVHDCPVTPDVVTCPLSGWHNRGLCFPGPDGNYQKPDMARVELQRMIAAYNRAHPGGELPTINLHALRHGWNTHADDLGVTQTVRMARLHQSTPAVNRGYTRALPHSQAEAASLVADMLFGAEVPPDPATAD